MVKAKLKYSLILALFHMACVLATDEGQDDKPPPPQSSSTSNPSNSNEGGINTAQESEQQAPKQQPHTLKVNWNSSITSTQCTATSMTLPLNDITEQELVPGAQKIFNFEGPAFAIGNNCASHASLKFDIDEKNRLKFSENEDTPGLKISLAYRSSTNGAAQQLTQTNNALRGEKDDNAKALRIPVLIVTVAKEGNQQLRLGKFMLASAITFTQP